MAAFDTVSVGGSLCASVSVFAGVQLSADCKGKHQVWPLLNLPHLRRSPVMGRVESMKHVGCRPEENKCMNMNYLLLYGGRIDGGWRDTDRDT